MAFEGLKEKLRDQWLDLSSKVQESSAFNSLRETYESQTPIVQRAVVIGGSVVLALFFLSFPYGYISQSQENMGMFEENRILIQGLLRASRAAKEPSPLPTSGSSDMLKSRVDSIVRDNQLIPDQIGEMQPLPDGHSKDLAPPAVRQAGLAVQLKKLNLNQVVSLGVAFQNMGLGTKLVGLDIIQSTGQTHYYDIVARIVTFSLPQMTFDNDPSADKGRSRPPPPKSKTEDEE